MLCQVLQVLLHSDPFLHLYLWQDCSRELCGLLNQRSRERLIDGSRVNDLFLTKFKDIAKTLVCLLWNTMARLLVFSVFAIIFGPRLFKLPNYTAERLCRDAKKWSLI